MNTSFNYGVDAGIALDQLSRRMKTLESRLTGVEQNDLIGHLSGSAWNNNNNNHTNSTAGNGPIRDNNNNSRHDRSRSNETNEIDKLRHTLDELTLRVEGNEDAIGNILSNNSKKQDSIGKYKNQNFNYRKNDDNVLSADSLRSKEIDDKLQILQSKIKALGSSTSKACKSLSVGMNDNQHAILLLYSWADRVYAAFDAVSTKLDFPSNICPRPHVYNPNPDDLKSQDFDIFNNSPSSIRYQNGGLNATRGDMNVSRNVAPFSQFDTAAKKSNMTSRRQSM